MEYLKRKDRIKRYRMAALLSTVAGGILLTIGLFLVLTISTSVPAVEAIILTVLLILFSTALLMLGVWAKPSARVLEMELEAYSKERERRMAQQPIQPAAAEPTAQLQYCSSCGKRLQPDWDVCGYCGKKLKKSD